MNSIVSKDIEEFTKSFELSTLLKDSRFLITGATGLIGSSLIHCLLALKKNIAIIAPVRNLQKAKEMFEVYELEKIQFIECDLSTYDYRDTPSFDYVVHCAAPTASAFFVSRPTETFDIIMSGTKALLNITKDRGIKSFVYLSSLEVYGEVHDDTQPITEEFQGYLDPLSVRSSYPMAKRATETLCHLYSQQYGVPVKIARLTQTTGAGIAKDDNRVIAQFTRLASRRENIVLHTTGESARPYCYITDCISAILYILLKGNNGESYNVANEETYISARGLADFIHSNIAKDIQVIVDLKSENVYAPPTLHRLSSKKLRSLGWTPKYGLKDIINRLLEYLSC